MGQLSGLSNEMGRNPGCCQRSISKGCGGWGVAGQVTDGEMGDMACVAPALSPTGERGEDTRH